MPPGWPSQTLDARAIYDAAVCMVELAQVLLGETRPHAAPGSTSPPVAGLTAREREVLGLVAQGSSDAEVAEALVVSRRTVHAHVRSIYRKLDVRSRSAATRYAVDHQLV
jgi:DNA-binding NarL/FixJ family response regulator